MNLIFRVFFNDRTFCDYLLGSVFSTQSCVRAEPVNNELDVCCCFFVWDAEFFPEFALSGFFVVVLAPGDCAYGCVFCEAYGSSCFFIEFYEEDRVELYDLSSDLGEADNLATECPDLVSELCGDLQRWRQSIGARMPVPNPDFDPECADLLPDPPMIPPNLIRRRSL